MVTIDFLEKVYSVINDQSYRITFSPAQKKNWMMECNGNFIGGLFDDEVCFVYTDAGSKLLQNPEPVYRGYSKSAQHKMLSVPLENAKDLLCATYKEKFDGATFICDIASIILSHNIGHPDVGERIYDEFVLFLRFCFENNLLKRLPIDRNGRLIQLTFHNRDLTSKGLQVFQPLLYKYLAFCDKQGKSDPVKMLRKWLVEMEKNHTK